MTVMLLDHLWQSTAVLAIVGLLTLCFRRNGAHVRHSLWTFASLKFLLPFAALTALGDFASSLLNVALPAPSLLTIVNGAAQPFSQNDFFIAPATTPVNWLPLLVVVWSAGFLAVCGVWLSRWLKLQATLREAKEADIAAPMPVKFSPTLLEPGLIGIFRSVLLLPHGISHTLSHAELQSVLAHEACHLRRRDNLTAALHMLVEAVFWFWPPVWWLGARLVAEREKACDEAVVAAGNDPQVYAESILKVCKHYVSSPLACASGVSGANLGRRMEDIMRNAVFARLNAPKKALLAVSAAAFLFMPMVAGMFIASSALARAQATSTPYPGTEAALRHQVEAWVRGKPLVSEMVPEVAGTSQQREAMLSDISKWGALKSITFRERVEGMDDYLVEFQNMRTVWHIGPLQDGKVGGLLIAFPALLRTDAGPSPGVSAALRHLLEGNLAGVPANDVMTPALQTIIGRQWDGLTAYSRKLGAIRSIDFQRINAMGWDVYRVTFQNGSVFIQTPPLQDGKLSKVQTYEILITGTQPNPGTEASLRRYVAALMRGQPNYEDMTPNLAEAVRNQLPSIKRSLAQLGALKSIAFRGQGPNDTDIYDATFEKGRAEWRMGPLTPDGKANRRGFASDLN